jgi:hypothetical protein
MIYEFYQELASNDFCPRGQAPFGHSSAEVTYNVLDANGKLLGRCNVPVFRLYRLGFDYLAVTFEKFDCSDRTPRNKALATVRLQELFGPRTRDGTTFEKVGVMGIGQARELCAVSKDLCVLKPFDREKELTHCAVVMLWPVARRPTSDACKLDR